VQKGEDFGRRLGGLAPLGHGPRVLVEALLYGVQAAAFSSASMVVAPTIAASSTSQSRRSVQRQVSDHAATVSDHAGTVSEPAPRHNLGDLWDQ
jgi:hypothetical protein